MQPPAPAPPGRPHAYHRNGRVAPPPEVRDHDHLPDRGKGVPSFDEKVDFALVEVDFDDPTTNVQGRRALAIAKPTPRGY